MNNSATNLYDTFKEWLDAHPETKKNVEFLSLQGRVSKEITSKFKIKRDGIHIRTVDELIKNTEKFEVISQKLSKNLDSLFFEKLPDIDALFYQSNAQNMKLRIIRFLKIKKHEIFVEGATSKYVQIQNKISELQSLISFITGGYIPNTQIINVFPSIYEAEPNKDNIIRNRQLIMIEAKIDALEKEVAAFKKPLWETDFEGFFMNAINEAHMRMDRELSYFSPFWMEDELSRAIFCRKTRYGERIDEVAAKACNNVQAYVKELVTLCYSLMPRKMTISNEKQSVALLILYRIGFNRTYELYPSLFAPKEDPLASKLSKLMEKPAKFFPLPLGLMQKIDKEKPIRTVFTEDKNFFAASQFLTNAEFDTNPIDALYNVHKCLIGIHKAAIINRLGETAASFEDMNQMLCFDDLFSLFIGTSLASELPSFNRLISFITDYSPKACLSPSFEYALSNFEALLIHFNNA